MRRTLALAALALGTAMTFSPVSAASAAPAPDCDIVQNCPCLIVDGVLYRATGYHWLACA